MNKFFLVSCLICVSLFGYSQSSNWSIATSLGIDIGGVIPMPLSNMPEDASGTPKIKPNVGLVSQYSINPKWSLGIEAGYHNLSIEATAIVISQAFWSDDRSYATYFSGEVYSDTELKFIEIPLYLKYRLGEKWHLDFGGYASFIFQGKMETEGRNGWISADKSDTDNAPLPGTQNTSFDFNEELDNYDIGALLGYQFQINERFHLWGRFSVGFKSIFIPEFQNIDYDMYQFRFGTGVAYKLW